MLPKKIIASKVNEEAAREFLLKKFNRFGISDIKMDKTPLGMKIVIKTPKPGAIVTRANQILKESSKELGQFFNQESPRIEVENSSNPNLDPAIVADSIAFKIAKYGPMKYKVVAHKAMDSIMEAGAKGVEIEIGGVIKERAAHFKFRPIGSVMPKTGQIEFFGVRTAKKQLVLKRGSIGIKVTIVVPTETIGGIKINGRRESEGSGDGAPENEGADRSKKTTT